MKRIAYRVYQSAMFAASQCLPWPETQVLSGEDCVLRLPQQLRKDGCARPLLMTGPTLHRLGAVKPLQKALADAGYEAPLFYDVQNDPSLANVEAAYTAYRNHGCDSIIAFGGGSPMDCAKLCGARVARPGKSIAQMKGLLHVRHKLPPLYAVPTTAGTGSEVTLAAVVTDEHHHKYMVGDLCMIPRAAVLDPAVTNGMPKGVTAASGMDALSHAVEAYIGRSNTAETRSKAEQATKLIIKHLPVAYRDGENREARAGMQQAAYLAGQAFTRANVGYVHAVAHALGGRYGIAHGTACALAMPVVLHAYGAAAVPALARLADAAGIGREAKTRTDKANAMIEEIEDLNIKLHMPTGFAQIEPEEIPVLAKQAADEGNPRYPVPKIFMAKELETVFIKLRQNGLAGS